jgi:ATP-dependent Clp protease adaptor protein ClpS
MAQSSQDLIDMSETITLPREQLDEDTESRTERQPPYHVILFNDDDHSYGYVIRMLKELFGYPEEKGRLMAEEVDTRGRVIVCTTSLERAELKRDQIHAYGPDPDITRSAGSMSAAIEPAGT